VVVGDFQQSANFGGSTFASSGGYQAFIAKYAGASGNHVWSRSGGGTGDDWANGVAVDGSGNVIVTGSFTGTANFGGTALVSTYNTGVLLAKYSSAGTHLWSRGFTAVSSFGLGSGRGVAADSVGNIVVAGTVCGAVGFDGLYLGNGSTDLLLAKFSGSNGGTLWAKSTGDLQSDYGKAVAVGAGNNVLAGGTFAISANLGGGLMQSAAPGELSGDAYIVKLSP
jgi:hypothetical protein